jgi:hypothetical protein
VTTVATVLAMAPRRKKSVEESLRPGVLFSHIALTRSNT